MSSLRSWSEGTERVGNDFEIVKSDRPLCDSGDLLVSDGGSLLHVPDLITAWLEQARHIRTVGAIASLSIDDDRKCRVNLLQQGKPSLH